MIRRVCQYLFVVATAFLASCALASPSDERLAVESGGVGPVVVRDSQPLAEAVASGATVVSLTLPPGFAFAGTNLADDEHAPAAKTLSDGSVRVECAVPSALKGCSKPTDLAFLVRATGAEGSSGVLKVEAVRDGKAVATLASADLVAVAKTSCRPPRRALPGVVLRAEDCHYRDDMGANYSLGDFLKEKGVRWVIPSLGTIRQEDEFVPLWRLCGMRYITPYAEGDASRDSLKKWGRGLDGFWLERDGGAPELLTDAFDKTEKWLSVSFAPDQAVAAVFDRAKESRARVERTCGAKRPKLMGLPPVACRNGRYEALEPSMDAVFFNGYEAVVPAGFSVGADARDWQAFGRSAGRMAKYEDAVFDGSRVDELTGLSPDADLRQATYEHRGVRIVACINGAADRRAFTLRARGLRGRYRVVREDGVILFGGRGFSGEELETTGVALAVDARTTCVFELRSASVLVYNEDDTHPILDQSADAYARWLDAVCQGAVTHFFMCPNAQLSNVPSKFLEPTWTAQGASGRTPRDFPAIMKKLHEKGVDPYSIWTKRARERGVSPWLTVRMNDVHFVNDLTYWGHSRFWKEHPEFRRDPSCRGSRWEDYALDYAHREVRERMLGYLGELAGRYDVDGIECDWMRFPYHLTKGRAREMPQVLTEFMAEARKVVSAAAARRGGKILLGARVTSSYEGALELGTDPVAWAKAGAIDWLVVGNFFGTADFNLDYADWRRRLQAADPHVTVIPSVDSGVRKEYWTGRQFLTLAEMQGWCDTQYAQGAPGVYVFNLFHYEENGLDAEWRAFLGGALAPSAVTSSAVRCYPVSFRECLSRKRPRSLTDLQVDQSADGLAVRIRVGTVPEDGQVAVRIALDREAGMLEQLKGAALNGVKAASVGREDAERWLTKETLSRGSFALTFPVSCVRSGVNVLQLPSLESVTLVACEMEIRSK